MGQRARLVLLSTHAQTGMGVPARWFHCGFRGLLLLDKTKGAGDCAGNAAAGSKRNHIGPAGTDTGGCSASGGYGACGTAGSGNQNNPKNFEALIELGNVFFDQKNFERCIELYTKGLELRPRTEVDIRTDLGTAMFYVKRYDDAIAQFKKSLELDPRHAQTLFNLGVVMLHGKGDAPAAVQYWEKLVDAQPELLTDRFRQRADPASQGAAKKAVKREVIDRLRGILGGPSVIEDDTELLVYECDATDASSRTNLMPLFSKNQRTVAQVVLDRERIGRIPSFPRGAGTGT